MYGYVEKVCLGHLGRVERGEDTCGPGGEVCRCELMIVGPNLTISNPGTKMRSVN
jgi:hypothetical protein